MGGFNPDIPWSFSWVCSAELLIMDDSMVGGHWHSLKELQITSNFILGELTLRLVLWCAELQTQLSPDGQYK